MSLHRHLVSASAPITCELLNKQVKVSPDMAIFITMNPGYAGRTELPESVKALFRPVVVIVPDLQQICEIMLFSEGFLEAKVSPPWPTGQRGCLGPCPAVPALQLPSRDGRCFRSVWLLHIFCFVSLLPLSLKF